jgi:hypothetical protein
VQESAFQTNAVSNPKAKRSSQDSDARSRDETRVMRNLIRPVYRFRDATLVTEKKDDFGNALQNLYRELQRAEDLVGPD